MIVWDLGRRTVGGGSKGKGEEVTVKAKGVYYGNERDKERREEGQQRAGYENVRMNPVILYTNLKLILKIK